MEATIAKKRRISSLFVTAIFIFSMVCASIPVACASAALSDIKGHWAQSTIQEMVSEGIAGGYPDGKFRPDNIITRAEFAVLAVRAFALEPGPGKVFADTANHWARDAIKTAGYHGLVSGYSDTAFGPDDPVTREQIAVMIANIANIKSTGAVKTFTDAARIAAWAKVSVEKATSAGLITGYPDGSFKPKANATRAEAAVILARSMAGAAEKEVLISTYEKAGTYGPESAAITVAGDVLISADGVILRNMIIKGNLTISEEVGSGDVTLNNVTVKGTTFIRGGGKDSIHISGGQYSDIIIERTPGANVRLVAIGTDGLKVIISEKAAGEEIILEGTFKSVAIKADNIVFSTRGKTKINELKVYGDLTGTIISLQENTTVKELVLDSPAELNNADDTVENVSGEKAPAAKETPGGSGASGGSGVPGGTAETEEAVFADIDAKIHKAIDRVELEGTGIGSITYANRHTVFTIAEPDTSILKLAETRILNLFLEMFKGVKSAKIVGGGPIFLEGMDEFQLKLNIAKNLIYPLIEGSSSLTLADLLGKSAAIEVTIMSNNKDYIGIYHLDFQ